MWNGKPDPTRDLVSVAPHLSPLARLPHFFCPEHLARGALEVVAGEYEPTPRGPMLRLKAGSRILDIGANVGAFAAWASERFPGCLIDSYEPNPQAFEFLKQNARGMSEVSAHNAGVLAAAGEARLHEGGLNLGEASIHEDVGAKRDEGRLCSFIDAATLPDAAIVKLDTEGCEVEILERYLAREFVPLGVLLEFHRAVDRLVLEELLELRGLHLVRGNILAPDRGTLVFLRVAAPSRPIVHGDALPILARNLPRAKPFIRA